MRTYDLVLVLKADIAETQREKLLDTVKTWLGNAKVDSKSLGKKLLSYPIKKEGEGIYILLNLGYTDGVVVPADVEKKLLMNDNVLRHLLVRRNVKKELTLTTGRRKGGDKKSK